MIDYSKLRSSLKRLEEQHANYRQENPALSDLDREAVAESVIQRFETCYDCLWKVLKRYLTEELGLAETLNSPRHICRLANENALFDAPVEQWFRYLRARIDTSHDYDGENTRESAPLSALRDALLPKLVSGDVRIHRSQRCRLASVL